MTADDFLAVLGADRPELAAELRLGGGRTSDLILRVRFDGEVLARLEVIRVNLARQLDPAAETLAAVILDDRPTDPSDPRSYWTVPGAVGRRAEIRAALGELAVGVGLDCAEVPPPGIHDDPDDPLSRWLWLLDPTLPAGAYCPGDE